MKKRATPKQRKDAPLPIEVPDLGGPIPDQVAEVIAKMLLEAADQEIAERAAKEKGAADE